MLYTGVTTQTKISYSRQARAYFREDPANGAHLPNKLIHNFKGWLCQGMQSPQLQLEAVQVRFRDYQEFSVKITAIMNCFL